MLYLCIPNTQPASLTNESMYRSITIVIAILCISAAATLANDSLPVIEVKADRTMIYPQRMQLTGEESLMDILQMMPELMIRGYEDVLDAYNLRIDNCPPNGDVRLILSQMKAKDIARIQVCDNTGVAKGTIGTNKVLDINMAMPHTVKGFVEGQGGFGKQMEGNGTVNVLYGSRKTDLYANATYRYLQGHKEYLSLHMTNRFDDRNRLLTYLTQQFIKLPSTTSQKIMGRARYFHTFNDAGTELLILGGYQYSSDLSSVSQLPMFVLELNTPLPAKGLTLLAGVEGDYQLNRQKDADKSWDVFNHDIYLQLCYALPQWRFTAGHRALFYNYRLADNGVVQKYFDIRNNTSASVIYIPHYQHQLQLGYHRKFYNPSDLALLAQADRLAGEAWITTRELLDERVINQLKLSYAYSRQQLTVQADAGYYFIRREENFAELNASAYWHTKWVTLTGGANLYIAPSRVFASIRLAPTAYLPRNWQIALQLVYFTPRSPIRELYGTPVYGCLSVNKQIASHWNLGIDWHDMFDTFCRTATVNRHAINIKAQYRF